MVFLFIGPVPFAIFLAANITILHALRVRKVRPSFQDCLSFPPNNVYLAQLILLQRKKEWARRNNPNLEPWDRDPVPPYPYPAFK